MMAIHFCLFINEGGIFLIKVIFVCLGNICRSPMAEAVFRDLTVKAKLDRYISVYSAGTGNWHVGEPPHEGTLSILRKHHIPTEGLIGRVITEEDIRENDYIIAMDESNVRNIKALAGKNDAHKIHLLLDFLPEEDIREVPDPYYTGNFEYVYDLIRRASEALLHHIKDKEKLNAS